MILRQGCDRRFSSVRVFTLASIALLALGGAPQSSAQSPAQASDAVPDLEKVQKAFTEVIDRVSPSVVGLRTHRAYPTAKSTGQHVSINGSGTVLDANGYVLTNEHVIQSAEDIEVYYHDGRTGKAIVVASDARSDLAVLKVDRKGLPAAAWCNWAEIARGQWTIAIGNPFGLGGDGKLCVSTGVISNLGRKLPGLGEIDDRLYNDMIQTTAAINPGNSGGPLFNIRGELIGVITAMHTRAAADEGVGFAIPLTPARRKIIEQLKNGQTIEYGYLGMSARAAEAFERRAAGIEDDGGAVVETIEPDGPAARAGIREGDFVMRFGEERVRDPGHLVELVGSSSIGQKIVLEIRRGRERMNIPVTVEKRQVSRVAWMRGNAILWRGMRLADLTVESRQRMQVAANAEGVVVIDVAKDSPAARAGLKIGDVIERIADARAADIGSFRDRVRSENGAVKLHVRARGELTIQP
jgi:serine protease Do